MLKDRLLFFSFHFTSLRFILLEIVIVIHRLVFWFFTKKREIWSFPNDFYFLCFIAFCVFVNKYLNLWKCLKINGKNHFVMRKCFNYICHCEQTISGQCNGNDENIHLTAQHSIAQSRMPYRQIISPWMHTHKHTLTTITLRFWGIEILFDDS